ncbi:dihydrodipicolinate synthase family protein [Paenibacillus sp. GXUN7292]|uniref:dihydrodipicolinate synthase family protein n=1 Tax=Paenibacillus sp. GXUN7292 TaxID=3422499 RepID=UPI003D7EA63F
MPFIIYRIPQTTGFHLSLQLLSRLALQKKVIGVKMSGESTFEMQQYKTAGGEGLLVFNGPDEPFLAGRIISHNDHDSQVQLNKEIEETAAYYFSK